MAISVVINTYNASLHLAKVLETVKGFDEIVICDMESTDNTLDIAREYGCKIVTFEKKNYNIVEPARNFAVQSAKNEWVLVVDADELVPNALKEYLYERIKDPNCPCGLFIPRKNYTMNMFLTSTYPDYQLRFLKRDTVYWPPIIHVVPEVNGPVDKIPANRKDLAFTHISVTVQAWLERLMKYTENEVKRREGAHVTFGKLLIQPSFHFFKSYILKGGFRYGKIGFIQACRSAIYKFVTLCRLLENELGKKD